MVAKGGKFNATGERGQPPNPDEVLSSYTCASETGWLTESKSPCFAKHLARKNEDELAIRLLGGVCFAIVRTVIGDGGRRFDA
jgi:hypothetical protein